MTLFVRLCWWRGAEGGIGAMHAARSECGCKKDIVYRKKIFTATEHFA